MQNEDSADAEDLEQEALAVANEPEDCYAEPYEEDDWPEDEDDEEELGTTQDFSGVLHDRPMDSWHLG